MTSTMLREELRKIGGRSAVFLIAVLAPILVAVIVAVGAIVVYQLRPSVDSIGGEKGLAWFSFPSMLAAWALIMLAGQAGSWDSANGTFRYLLLSGRSRGSLYFTRVAAVLSVALLSVGLVIAVGVTFALLAPTAPGDKLTASSVANYVGVTVLYVAFWALFAHGIGSLTGSVGAAIMFAFVAYFGGELIGSLGGHVSREITYLLPGEAINRLSSDSSSPLWLAIAVLIGWSAVAVYPGYAHTQAAEY